MMGATPFDGEKERLAGLWRCRGLVPCAATLPPKGLGSNPTRCATSTHLYGGNPRIMAEGAALGALPFCKRVHKVRTLHD